MKIVVTANGTDLDAEASPIFGRCPVYVSVDTGAQGEGEPWVVEAVENPAINAAGGAGTQAAQFVVEQGAEVVLTGNVGPNAHRVLQAADISIHLFSEGTVREVVEAYQAGELPPVGGASAPAHAGMGMGRGGARRMGRQAASRSSRQEEIADLKRTAGDLRKQLAEVLDRLDRLEKGG